MLILTLETSSSKGSLGIYEKTSSSIKTLFEKTWENYHSEVLFSFLEQGLKDSHKSLNDLQALLVSVGPGSFTGIRVACSFVKSLSYSLNIPIFFQNSLKVLAYKCFDFPQKDFTKFANKKGSVVYTCLNAFKNSVYLASYEILNTQTPSLKEILSPYQVPITALKSFQKNSLVLGHNLKAYEGILKNSIKDSDFKESFPHCKTLVQMFLTKDLLPSSWKQLQPLYVKSPVS